MLGGGVLQGYSWLKDRILGEEGRRQQMQLRELGLIAEQLGCSLAQLAIGQSVRRRRRRAPTQSINQFICNKGP